MKIRIRPNTLDEKRKKKKKSKKGRKDDRCTRIAKRKYDTWPSAYASGAVVKCRQGKIWKGLKEGTEEGALEDAEEEILDTLEDEGGAAGLEPLEKALSDNEELPDDFDIEEFLKDIPGDVIKKHEDGDYIEMGGLDEAKKKKKAGTESSKESSLHDWFKRKGAKGKTGGWVDCNTCRKDKKTGKKKCKPCGREKGEKRSKYPACRPTPGACEERGRGKSWGKKSKKKSMSESAGEYVYGVKNPERVANKYTIKVVKK